MRIPKTFVLEKKNFDEKLKDILQDEKPFKQDEKPFKQINDILSLACVPENIGNYALRTDFEKITKKKMVWHFGEQIPQYLVRAGEMTYQLPLSPVFTSVYILEFKSGTDLNKINKKINLEKEINQEHAVRTKCLKKDSYLVAIKVNWTDKDSLDVFGSWYLNNFGLEEL